MELTEEQVGKLKRIAEVRREIDVRLSNLKKEKDRLTDEVREIMEEVGSPDAPLDSKGRKMEEMALPGGWRKVVSQSAAKMTPQGLERAREDGVIDEGTYHQVVTYEPKVDEEALDALLSKNPTLTVKIADYLQPGKKSITVRLSKKAK